jgi:hypothetical protein
MSLRLDTRAFARLACMMRRMNDKPRIARERSTVRHMVEIYCRDNHEQSEGLCERCNGLFSYAMARLDHCIYQEDKPTCKKCPVHCYKKDMRAAMRQVMIHSGPRMLLSHPILAVRHLLDERKEAPRLPARQMAP